MDGVRSPKILFIVLALLLLGLYSMNTGRNAPSNVEILSYDLNYQPDRIKVEVEVQNNSDHELVFEAFSLHCSDVQQQDVSFKVLNNSGDDAIPSANTAPLRLAAGERYKMDLIAEKNEFYRSGESCKTIASSWKISNERNYYGTPVTVLP